VFAERRGLFEDNSGMPRNVTLYPLKYSEDEIESVRDKFKSVSFYNGSDATETNFKEQAEKSGIIHLSTHSWLIGKQPAIFFSPEPDSLNDGILEAGEVAQLNLHANLVALSSCNSGEGLHEASEGIVGMTKAFLDAGAASVVVSLWEVNDRYTAEFMKLFYSGLREGKTKPQALREAKQKFIQDISPNPYYWSGFVLVGNVDPLPAEFIGSTTNKALYLAAGFFLAILLLLLRKIYRVKTAINTR
jgi:CHAT domain-containing protein